MGTKAKAKKSMVPPHLKEDPPKGYISTTDMLLMFDFPLNKQPQASKVCKALGVLRHEVKAKGDRTMVYWWNKESLQKFAPKINEGMEPIPRELRGLSSPDASDSDKVLVDVVRMLRRSTHVMENLSTRMSALESTVRHDAPPQASGS